MEPEVLPDNQLDILKEFLPDADPDFLTMQFYSFEGKADKVKAFLNEAMEKRNYPKMKDYLRYVINYECWLYYTKLLQIERYTGWGLNVNAPKTILTPTFVISCFFFVYFLV